MDIKKYTLRLKECFKKYLERHSAFFDGMGSFSLFPSRRLPYWMKNNLTPEEQDALAIRGDWEQVRGDLRIAMEKYEASLSNEEYKKLLSSEGYKKLLFSKLRIIISDQDNFKKSLSDKFGN